MHQDDNRGVTIFLIGSADFQLLLRIVSPGKWWVQRILLISARIMVQFLCRNLLPDLTTAGAE
jgi:hypothetical protein